jgi:hypothetical protein
MIALRAAFLIAAAAGFAVFTAHQAIPRIVWEVQNAQVERY